MYLWIPSSLVCCLKLSATYFQNGNLPPHASQVSEPQVVSMEYDALKKWGLFWRMVMACPWQGCPWRLGTWGTWVPWKYVRRELLHFGRALWESQRSTFHGICLPWKVQQSLGIPTPPCHLNSIELIKWVDPVYDISFSKFPRNLVSSGYDFPLPFSSDRRTISTAINVFRNLTLLSTISLWFLVTWYAPARSQTNMNPIMDPFLTNWNFNEQ